MINNQWPAQPAQATWEHGTDELAVSRTLLGRQARGTLDATSRDLGGAPVRLAHPGGVDAKGGGSTAAVAEAAGHGAQVNPGAEAGTRRCVAGRGTVSHRARPVRESLATACRGWPAGSAAHREW